MIMFTVRVLNLQLDSGETLAKGRQSSNRATRRRHWTKTDETKFSQDTVVEDEVYVGRGSGKVKRSQWANPFKIGVDGSREGC